MVSAERKPKENGDSTLSPRWERSFDRFFLSKENGGGWIPAELSTSSKSIERRGEEPNISMASMAKVGDWR